MLVTYSCHAGFRQTCSPTCRWYRGSGDDQVQDVVAGALKVAVVVALPLKTAAPAVFSTDRCSDENLTVPGPQYLVQRTVTGVHCQRSVRNNIGISRLKPSESIINKEDDQ